MKNRKSPWLVPLLILSLLLISSSARAEEAIGAKLTPRLKQLIGEEMRQVSTAMQTILMALVQGDHPTIAEQGERIHHSFIMKRSLTAADKKQLMATLPPAFIKLDRSFHGLAKKLATAAHAHDSELERFYFSRMTETCTICHGTYALDRFPGLAEPGMSGGHSHH